MLSSCGESGSGSGSGGGSTHSTGTFSVLVPKGWKVNSFYMSGGTIVEPNIVAVYKGDYAGYCPLLQIYLYPGGEGHVPENRDNYRETSDFQIKEGNYTWTGFKGMTRKGFSEDYIEPLFVIETEMDGNKMKIACWPEMGGDQKISFSDTDVKAIIASIKLEK